MCMQNLIVFMAACYAAFNEVSSVVWIQVTLQWIGNQEKYELPCTAGVGEFH